MRNDCSNTIECTSCKHKDVCLTNLILFNSIFMATDEDIDKLAENPEIKEIEVK
jgi:hypothetical protein